MKNTIKASLLALVLTASFACKKDKEERIPTSTSPVMVEFMQEDLQLGQGQKTQVKIKFHRPADAEGSIEIDLVSGNQQHFATTPEVEAGIIELAFQKGATGVSFELLNMLSPGQSQEQIRFEIAGVPHTFKLGSKKEINISISSQQPPVNSVSSLFLEDSLEVTEGVAEMKFVEIFFSSVPTNDMELSIQLKNHQAADLLISSPQVDASGNMVLKVLAGSHNTGFYVQAKDDHLLRGHQKLNFQIAHVQGGKVGERKDFTLKLIDDELRFKPRSYETVGGGWRAKNTYEYDVQGRISKIHWENATPGVTKGTYTYFYGTSGLIERINRYAGVDEYFTENNGRIERSREVHHGEVRAYRNYDYSASGKLTLTDQYYLQPNGEFKLSWRIRYTYHPSGNLHEQIYYFPDANGNFLQGTTHIYDDYTELVNNFPFLDLIPGVVMQPNMAASYKLISNGQHLQYYFRYDVKDGLPSLRYTTGAGSETTRYSYY